MKKIILSLIVLFWLFVLVNSISQAANPYVCGTNRLFGKVTSPDPLNTTVVVSLSWPASQSITATVWVDGSYEAIFDDSLIIDWLYSVTSTATLSWLSDTWTYEISIWENCGVCGNEVIDGSEECEQDSQCEEWSRCGGCACINNDEMKELIKSYAQEVADYKQNASFQVLPSRFVDTWPFAFVDSVIDKVGVKFALWWKNTVYNTLPDWTIDPMIDTNSLSFDSVYGAMPKIYRDKEVYLQFKWLFVPVLSVEKTASPEDVLTELNEWAVLAPETPSINTLWAVKMLYTHSLSTTPSPFAWIGSYLSVFWEEGDIFHIYVKKWSKSYEKRTYTIKSKFQIKPEQTAILNKFYKEWADSLALITCRDGNILWSTKAREIILADRNRDEMWWFQKAMMALWDDKKLAEAKAKIDKYLQKKDLSEEQVSKLVAKLDEVADDGEWNPLAVIATYGKYMSAYDAVYNDKAF